MPDYQFLNIVVNISWRIRKNVYSRGVLERVGRVIQLFFRITVTFLKTIRKYILENVEKHLQ